MWFIKQKSNISHIYIHFMLRRLRHCCSSCRKLVHWLTCLHAVAAGPTSPSSFPTPGPGIETNSWFRAPASPTGHSHHVSWRLGGSMYHVGFPQPTWHTGASPSLWVPDHPWRFQFFLLSPLFTSHMFFLTAWLLTSNSRTSLRRNKHPSQTV